MHTHVSNPITQVRLDRLREAAGNGPVLILTHDNPDPDSLATGKGLAALLSVWGIPSRMVYSGLVARAENRAMLNRLTPEWEHSDTLEFLDEYPAIALVDSQPTAGNNRLPAPVLPTIVIDLSRGAAPADEAVYLELLARANRSELIQVEHAGLTAITSARSVVA